MTLFLRSDSVHRALVAAFTGSVACTPGDSGDNTTETAAVDAAHYRPPGHTNPVITVITFASTQLGKPYVYGATGLNAYDCSGLIVAAPRPHRRPRYRVPT